ncbi:MAG: response regulator [Thaumarchaeota archaeon]|nr:response regulator [Nitrososphaerota archaeon]
MDDDEIIRTTFTEILKHEGYDVDVAEDGAQAIDKSNSKLFDLALVDMRLPDMLGTDLLDKMRKTTPKMAKIMVTATPTLRNAIAAVNRGADGYITKPVVAEDLLAVIREHLQKRDEAAKYSDQKVAEFVQTRARELQAKQSGAGHASSRSNPADQADRSKK